ncbi:putative multidrug resistance protein, partial [Tanacetum coccineum]
EYRHRYAVSSLMDSAYWLSEHSMKDGYNFYCGERGMRLSSGQKQRITIARAILKILAILLLYEATSALDLRLEALVQDALEKTMVGRNNVIVAHRLSTIKKSNRISVIDNGRVIEEGSHDELLAKGEEVEEIDGEDQSRRLTAEISDGD